MRRFVALRWRRRHLSPPAAAVRPAPAGRCPSCARPVADGGTAGEGRGCCAAGCAAAGRRS